MFDLIHPELFRGKVARLKNGNVFQKILNAFRRSGGESRAQVLQTSLYGDESWRRDDQPKSGA